MDGIRLLSRWMSVLAAAAAGRRRAGRLRPRDPSARRARGRAVRPATIRPTYAGSRVERRSQGVAGMEPQCPDPGAARAAAVRRRRVHCGRCEFHPAQPTDLTECQRQPAGGAALARHPGTRPDRDDTRERRRRPSRRAACGWRPPPAETQPTWVVTAQQVPTGTIVEFGLTVRATFAAPDAGPPMVLLVSAGGLAPPAARAGDSPRRSRPSRRSTRRRRGRARRRRTCWRPTRPGRRSGPDRARRRRCRCGWNRTTTAARSRTEEVHR